MDQAPLAQRLWSDMAERLAVRLGVCPVHTGNRLICARCDMQWTGTVAEEAEMEDLLQRTTLHHLTWPTWACARCDTQDVALCPDCYAPVADQASTGLTPAEEARYSALLSRHMRVTCLPDPGVADDLTGAHEGGETP